MRDLMIDIETLGTSPGSVILSIGAVMFDAIHGKMGTHFYTAIDMQSCVNKGLSIHVPTLKWWMQQSSEAQSSTFNGETPLEDALEGFEMFFKACNPDRLWAKPPQFDVVMLQGAYDACGMDVPWHFRSPRDCRTLFELSGVSQPKVGTAHNALDDALSQAQGVMIAYEALGKAVR